MARPREFDREQALEDAMQAFWDHGYEGTSTAMLEERMRIGRSSLYATFGSKDELYREAMERYARNLRERIIDRLRAEGPARDVLERFFLRVADRGQPDAERLRSCMVVRACLSRADQPPAIRKRVAGSIAELDAAFHELLQRARREGALGKQVHLRSAARYLTTTLQALNVAANAGRPPRELREMVRTALSTLD